MGENNSKSKFYRNWSIIAFLLIILIEKYYQIESWGWITWSFFILWVGVPLILYIEHPYHTSKPQKETVSINTSENINYSYNHNTSSFNTSKNNHYSYSSSKPTKSYWKNWTQAKRDGTYKQTYTDNKGYLIFRDSGAFVHRWAAEKKLGRKLLPGEVVHHKNRDKTDNSWKNLYVFKNQKAHTRAHKYDKRTKGKW